MIETITDKQKRAIAQYLHRHAEEEADNLAHYISNNAYQHCIVIPAYHENNAFIERIQKSPLSQARALIIVVINQPDDTSCTVKNQALWDSIAQLYTTINKSPLHHYLSIPSSHTDILMVDRFTLKIPKKQGVGLARKIGADIACQLLADGRLHNPWVHHTDADTHLPENYFSALHTLSSKELDTASAAIYAYQHRHSDESSRYTATQHYEQALHYYVDGLKRAGSPYAYHTLGSCIVTHAYYYAQAHGFPKKAGGEDFYLLNKLAKLGDIVNIPNTQLLIDARHSDRVPFGTGPAVDKILAMSNPDDEYLYYHPDCFDELAMLLTHFTDIFQYRCRSTNDSVSPLSHYTPWLSQLSKPLQKAVSALGIDALLQHIDKQIHQPQQCIEHCHQWLDAFKTLKLIHLLEIDHPKQVLSVSLQQHPANLVIN
jgi:hypothetical protein